MQAIDLVRASLKMSDGLCQRLVADLRDHAMTTQSPGQGNPTLWTLGHLAFLEAGIPSILFGEPHPLPRYEAMFTMGSTPKRDANAYPSYDELLANYTKARQRTLEIVEQVGDAGMSRVPAAIPKGFESVMSTFGQTFLTMGLHTMFHMGEVADVRRVVGLKPFN